MQAQQQRVRLTALGVWDDGPWEMLPWPRALEEEAPSWGTWWGTWDPKGITEATTQLSVSDGAKGLDKALSSHLYGVPHQRGLCHTIKNIAEHWQSREGIPEAHEAASAPSRKTKQVYKKAILADAGQI